jgi:hypothetical protein
MGIKRRMIDIGKTITFYFFAKCMKMYIFFRICIRSLQKKISPKNQYGYQKNAEFYADFQFVDASFKIYSKKVISKKPRKSVQSENTQNSHSSSAITF